MFQSFTKLNYLLQFLWVILFRALIFHCKSDKTEVSGLNAHTHMQEHFHDHFIKKRLENLILHDHGETDKRWCMTT